MSARVQVRVGDVFEVPFGDDTKGYFQFIMRDLTQLHSEVIRAFKRRYPLEATITAAEVVQDEVDFFAHVFVRWGLKKSLWTKLGRGPLESDLQPPRFRDSLDYGDPTVVHSAQWRVWAPNEEFEYAGPLQGIHTTYDIGVVINPQSIVDRMRTGTHSFQYPGY